MANEHMTAPKAGVHMRVAAPSAIAQARAQDASSTAFAAEPQQPTVLDVQHIEKVYGARGSLTRALTDVSFTVRKGDFVGIMGASGFGQVDAAQLRLHHRQRHKRHRGDQRCRCYALEAGQAHALSPRAAGLHFSGFQPARHLDGAREHCVAAHHWPRAGQRCGASRGRGCRAPGYCAGARQVSLPDVGRTAAARCRGPRPRDRPRHHHGGRAHGRPRL